MPRSKKHTAEQIIAKLRTAELELAKGRTADKAAKKIGVTEQTYYRWHKRVFPRIEWIGRRLPGGGTCFLHYNNANVIVREKVTKHSVVQFPMGRGVLVHPVFFGVGHTFPTGHLPVRAGPVKRATLRAVAERLEAVLPSRRVPLVDDHLDRPDTRNLCTSPFSASA